MKIKKGIIFILLGLLILVIGACSEGNNDDASNEENGDISDLNLTWGSGSSGSSTFSIISGLTSIASDYTEFKNNSIATSGTVENTILVDEKEIDLGMATSDGLHNGAEGNDPFDKEMEYSQVLTLVSWNMPIIVLEDSEINSMDDLKGKTLNTGTPGGSAAVTFEKVLEEYDLTDEINIENLDAGEAAEALKEGQIDATILSYLNGNMLPPAYDTLSRTDDLKMIDLDIDILEKVEEEDPGLTLEKTQKQDVLSKENDTLTTTGILIVNPSIPDEAVYQITKNLLENEDEAQNITRELSEFSKENALSGLVEDYPVHPGAQKYYEEIGIWEDFNSQ